MKYLFIAEHKKVWPIDIMCEVFRVHRGGFYQHEKKNIELT
jgi:hypothetical protein